MDRTLVYAGQVPRALDNLLLGRFAMVGLAKLAEAMLGTSTIVSQGGFAVTPGGGLNIAVGSGQIYQLESIEPTTESALNVDGHQVLKQGIALDAQTLTLVPPNTVGYAQNFLLQVAYQDVPTGPVVLSFQNPTPVLDPSTNTYKYVTYPGPGGNGAQSYTILQGGVSVIAKPGAAATAGSQTTPTPNAGYVGLYVITLAYGDTSVSTGNISTYSGAPFIPVTLPGVPAGVQAGSWTYAVDTGASGALVAALSPAPTSLPDGMEITVLAAHAAAGGDTLNLNGFGALPIKRKAGATPSVNDWAANDTLILIKRGSTWQFAGIVPSDVSSVINNYQIAGGRYVTLTGSGTWTVPANAAPTIRILMNGGGGGGGGCYTSGSIQSAGTGGGGGEYAEGTFNVTPGQALSYVVGTGGSGGQGSSSPTSGLSGGTTSIGGLLSAVGGGGGPGATNSVSSSGAAGGTGGSGGGRRLPGGGGGYGILTSTTGTQGGQGGYSPFGGPGTSPNINNNGTPGSTYGGGGAGGSASSTSLSGNGGGGSNGGNGAAGTIVIQY